MKILFLSVHRPGRSPSQRFRFEQYLDWLRTLGWQCDHSWVLDADDDATFYGRANLWAKARVGLRVSARRLGEILPRAARRYDCVFVQREALFLGPPVMELTLHKLGAPLVFDFDDAIWIPAISEANKRFAWMKSESKTTRLVSAAKMVFAGNRHLADFARARCARVEVVPTTIDTDEYVPRSVSNDARPVCIGWSGSFSTLAHFKLAVPVLRRVKARFGDRVQFKVIGDPNFSNPGLGVRGDAWKLETELDDLRKIDVGLMPLPDDDWAKGKCGLKGLQYMALEIPTLMSPVGVNEEIIADGENGFLPRSDEEWFERLSELVQDPALRRRLGSEGRRTVEQRFSVRAWRPRYQELLESVAHR